MGSPTNEALRNANETQHIVILTRGVLDGKILGYTSKLSVRRGNQSKLFYIRARLCRGPFPSSRAGQLERRHKLLCVANAAGAIGGTDPNELCVSATY